MAVSWTAAEVLQAVRRHLSTSYFEYRDLISEVEIDGDDIRVVLRKVGTDHRPHGIRYSLSKLPLGPCTGEECASVDQWAIEISWDLDEVIGTREIETADRRTEPDGVVLLRWWKTENWSR